MQHGHVSRPKYVREIKDIPIEPHFAVLLAESMTYDDGYGERGQSSTSTLQYLNYIAFENIEQVTAWVREQEDASRRFGSKKEFRVIEVRPCTIYREVRISVTLHTPDV